jgi:hypothetical protein
MFWRTSVGFPRPILIEARGAPACGSARELNRSPRLLFVFRWSDEEMQEPSLLGRIVCGSTTSLGGRGKVIGLDPFAELGFLMAGYEIGDTTGFARSATTGNEQ